MSSLQPAAHAERRRHGMSGSHDEAADLHLAFGADSCYKRLKL